MTTPIKIYSVEVFNLNSTAMFCGEPVPKGCLGIQVSREPKFVYRRVGNFFIAEDGGFAHYYEYKPGTTKGFAGAKITLPVAGIGKVFKNKGITRVQFTGSLWDTFEARQAAERELGGPLRSIGVRTRMDGCYSALSATKGLMDRLARVVVLGSPEQSPLI